jgi:hypothetical protein
MDYLLLDLEQREEREERADTTAWVQVLKCGNCGAKLSPEQCRCDYCGSFFKPVIKNNYDQPITTLQAISGSIMAMTAIAGSFGWIRHGSWISYDPYGRF